MDIKNNFGIRTSEHTIYNATDEMPKYDYVKEGILNKCLPKILFKGNSILVTFIQLIDLRCIMMFKYIDKLKKFKWITWY